MSKGPMVLVMSASNDIQAQIIGARLGAEGMLWELRPTVGAPYAVGAVEVLVEAARADEARELLLSDDVEAVFDDDGSAPITGRRSWVPAVLVVAVVLAFVVMRMLTLT